MNLLKLIVRTSALLFTCFSTLAQTEITLVSSSFSATDNTYIIDKKQLINKLASNESITLDIPMPDYSTATSINKTITITRHHLLSSHYGLFTSHGKIESTASKYSFYHGIVDGQLQSKVAITLVYDVPVISIMDSDGNYEIYPTEEGGFKGSFRTVEENFDLSTWACETIEEEENEIDNKDNSPLNKSVNSECTEIFLEIDHNMYNKKGSSVSNTEAWALSLMNQVAILYMEWDVPLNISGIQVWDTVDPYIDATNTSQALSLFRVAVQSNPNFNGRLAHLLSGRGLGGGIAYLSSLCSNSTNVAVSANLSGGVANYPTYSWNTMVIAHELGHNFGSRHTHSCSWNGNNTAIDGCYSTEGSCPKPAIPYDEGGTIMSYCHLTSAGINLTNGFGPQPGALIKDRFENASCITGTNCAPVAPFNDVCARAREIDVHNYCIEGIFNNSACNASGNGGAFSCGNTGDEKDMWFKTTYPSLDSFYIELSGVNGKDLVVEIYSGTCSSLTSLECAFTTNGDTIIQNIFEPSQIGEELFIRIVEDGSDEDIDFRICLYSPVIPCNSLTDSLIQLYHSTGGPNWTNKSGWEDGANLATCDYCNWYGVVCDYNGKITTLNLSHNNLSGPIPPQIVDLQDLQSLDLSGNNISGPIPIFWDSLDQLTMINLGNNNLTDTIPLAFRFMNKIDAIYLDNNNLTGQVPEGIGYGTLRSFSASNNNLTGCFASSLSSLCFRDSLNLSNNPNLVFMGDVTLLCTEYMGRDDDHDGYCSGVGDCDDYDENINEGAPELDCDGLDNNCDTYIDENSDYGPNSWIGPDTLGVWTDSTNWSMGHPPKPCELVVIGSSGTTSHVRFTSAQYMSMEVRSITIGSTSSLYIDENIYMQLKVDGRIVNYGRLVLAGYISVNDQLGTDKTAIYNEGIIEIDSFGGFNMNDLGHYGIENKPQAQIHFSGYSWLGNYEGTTAKSAIKNEGEIYILGNLGVSGSYIHESIESLPGSLIYIVQDGKLELYTD